MTSDSDQIPEQDNDKQAAAAAAQQPEQAPAVDAEQADAEQQVSIEELAQELTKAQATIKDYWDQIMRLNAEIENNRKRAQRDIEHAHKYAISNLIESLLPVTDSMELGLNASQADNATLDSIREGMTITLNMFIQTLEKNGVQAVDPVGEKFNPEHHQAMSMMEDAEASPNTVLTVMQKGYLLNDRLVRPAMVVVSKEKS
ncbi:MAG: nucleotide exchange factor GrpE [Gammaproteobacteria bacterium]|nr:nucleotide exchange factor GrpE [Gammaproteobacteria bacterium]